MATVFGHSVWELWRMVSGLTWRKLHNALRVLWSYQQSRLLRKSHHRGLPLALSVEPTTSCNLRCPQCPSGLRSFTRPTGMLDMDTYTRILDELGDHLLYLTIYFQGEPYLHPGFFELVRAARDRGIFTCSSTNAHYLSDEAARKTVESGLDRLIISLDGLTQSTYSAYRRGGSLEKVLKGAHNLQRWKLELGVRNPEVYFQFLVFRWNEHEIPAIRQFARDQGIGLLIKTAQVYGFQNDRDFIPENTALSRYRRNRDGSYAVRRVLQDRCWRMWHSAVVTWDGQVLPCCFDKDADHAMGSLNESSFRAIWGNERYEIFRNQLLKSRRGIEMCHNCSEGNPVWL